MNWQHLSYFKVLVEEGSFSKATEKLFITPSALSKAITSLEAELEFDLFERAGRKSVLTANGKIFFESVVKAFSDINTGINNVRFASNPNTGHLRIGSGYNALISLIPKCIKSFKEDYPHAIFSIKYIPGNILLKALAYGEYDLGFCNALERYGDILEQFPSIEYKRYDTKKLFLLVPNSHPFAKKDVIEFKDLENLEIIASPASADYNYLLEKAEHCGFKPNITIKTYDRLSTLSMVDLGLGTAVISFSEVTKPSGNFNAIPIDCNYHKDEFVLWNNLNQSAISKCFIDKVLSVTQND